MKFVSVMVKRSKFNGGNIHYSVLTSNILLKTEVSHD